MTAVQMAISTFANFIKNGIDIIFTSNNILFVLPATGCIIITIWDIIASFLDTKDD